MLWVMSELDGADNLLREMRIAYPASERPEAGTSSRSSSLPEMANYKR
jgi:hypothetical protein